MTFVASYFDPSMYSGRRFALYDPQAGPFSQNGFDLEPRTIADLAGSEDIQSAAFGGGICTFGRPKIMHSTM